MINVTQPFLPPMEEYQQYLSEIWERKWLTNYGPLVKQLESGLNNYLGTEDLIYCTNGTIALQVSLKGLGISGEVITTPFSYVATTNSILWEGCTPVFVDIRSDDLCIDASLIEAKITERTQAIMAVHVYGFPCDVEVIEHIARKHGLKVIYDGAHAFGVNYNGKSLLSYGDVSTCSFHATKLYHTIEGGAVIANGTELSKKLRRLLSFGHINDDYFEAGINGKNSEFHAAMGLCNLKHINEIIGGRKKISETYDALLNFRNGIRRPTSVLNFEYNYAYYPVLFETGDQLLRVKNLLAENGINTRRYFYPSLNNLTYLNKSSHCKLSESLSRCVLALPMYNNLEDSSIERISSQINNAL